MQKGYKRQAKGLAVLRCFIGLFIVIIIVLLATFLLGLDYSDKLTPGASVRPYVETTSTPVPVMTATPAATTQAATPAPTATPKPTPTPTPTPTVAPTPEPTFIPVDSYSKMQAPFFPIPAASTMDTAVAITHSYRSSADGNKVLQLQGYAYVNDATFDGANAMVCLLLTQESTGVQALVSTIQTPGLTGLDHGDAVCQNASNTDFEAFISVAGMKDDIYSLGIAILYYVNSQPTVQYVPLGDNANFTVLNGQFISDIPLTEDAA